MGWSLLPVTHLLSMCAEQSLSFHTQERLLGYTIILAATPTHWEMTAFNLDFNQWTCLLFFALVDCPTHARSASTLWNYPTALDTSFWYYQLLCTTLQDKVAQGHTEICWSVTALIAEHRWRRSLVSVWSPVSASWLRSAAHDHNDLKFYATSAAICWFYHRLTLLDTLLWLFSQWMNWSASPHALFTGLISPNCHCFANEYSMAFAQRCFGMNVVRYAYGESFKSHTQRTP